MFQTQDPAALLKQMLGAFGGSSSQPFTDWSSLLPGAGAAVPPELTSMQKEWMDRHATLWRSFVARPVEEAQGGAPEREVSPVRDRRFASDSWQSSPIHDYARRAYLLNADFLKALAEKLPVKDDQSRQRLRFAVAQYVEAMAPSNFAATNPDVINAALETRGESIRRGIENLLSDLDKGRISMTDESAFEVGRNLATTPGAVVFENEIFQLIQYSPMSEKVGQVPLVMVPPCINKYYILDLQAQNSFVRFAVEQGNTVFLVSWRNVKADQGHLGWDDYIERGALTAISRAREICGVKQVNALGFCVGGTILTSSLAVARARGENPVKSLTLLTTLLDFSDVGELGMFIDEASVAGREMTLGKGGVYSGRELSSVFSALRPNDLIWQYVVGNYLKGSTPQAFDLLYWNSDPTNLPGPFFAWYLRNMYLENSLRIPGKLEMCGVRADLGKVDMPAFVLAAREDHIVPWQSAFSSSKLLGGDVTFVLGASGHIAGVINPASSGKRNYWVNSDPVSGAEQWLGAAEEVKGSWWPVWADWLKAKSGKKIAARAQLGNEIHRPIEPAPGRYVKEKA